MSLAELAVLVVCAAAATSHTVTRCEMVPFETDDFVGQCCVVAKRNASASALPKAEVAAVLKRKLGQPEDGQAVLFPGEYKTKVEEEKEKKGEEQAKNGTLPTTTESAVPENVTITANRNGVGVPDSPCPTGQVRDVSGVCVEGL